MQTNSQKKKKKKKKKKNKKKKKKGTIDKINNFIMLKMDLPNK